MTVIFFFFFKFDYMPFVALVQTHTHILIVCLVYGKVL